MENFILEQDGIFKMLLHIQTCGKVGFRESDYSELLSSKFCIIILQLLVRVNRKVI